MITHTGGTLTLDSFTIPPIVLHFLSVSALCLVELIFSRLEEVDN